MFVISLNLILNFILFASGFPLNKSETKQYEKPYSAASQ